MSQKGLEELKLTGITMMVTRMPIMFLLLSTLLEKMKNKLACKRIAKNKLRNLMLSIKNFRKNLIKMVWFSLESCGGCWRWWLTCNLLGNSEEGINYCQEYLAQVELVEEWDCESVLSTYSTTDNHPSVIRSVSTSVLFVLLWHPPSLILFRLFVYLCLCLYVVLYVLPYIGFQPEKEEVCEESTCFFFQQCCIRYPTAHYSIW